MYIYMCVYIYIHIYTYISQIFVICDKCEPGARAHTHTNTHPLPHKGAPCGRGPLGQEKKVVLERGWWKSCVGSRQMKKSCHSRTTKIIQVVTIKPNNYMVWQHQTKQLHCTTTPNQTIPLSDNTKPNNSIVWQHVRTWYYDKRIMPKIMCPHPLPHKGAPCGRGPLGQEKKVVLERGWWKSCVTRGQQKLYKL